MRLNRDQFVGRFADVFLNGEQVDAAFEASEDDGYVIVEYRDVNNNAVVEADAEKGALLLDGLQVLKLCGDVRIVINLGDFKPLPLTVKQ